MGQPGGSRKLVAWKLPWEIGLSGFPGSVIWRSKTERTVLQEEYGTLSKTPTPEREGNPLFFAEPLDTNRMSEELVEPSSDAVC